MPKFATVNQLARHIEILLLSNDCVIVPSLGGFVAHHICARYVEDEGLFLPPLRTLGFNAQLTMNDSLLAQSYAEALDMSLPGAQTCVEQDVERLIAVLNERGEAELYDLGRLYKNAEGHLAFQPCEAGILTPSLYALSSFELQQLHTTVTTNGKAAASSPSVAAATKTAESANRLPVQGLESQIKVPAAATANAQNEENAAEQSRMGHAITVSMRVARNTVAVAAAVAAVLLFTSPINQITTVQQPAADTQIAAVVPTIGQNSNGVRTAKQRPSTKVATVESVTKNNTATNNTPATQVTPAAPNNSTVQNTPSAQKASVSNAAPAATAQAKQPVWSIVLCSHVSQAGAEYFVKQLAADNVEGARISNSGVTKVLYGHYATREEAQATLNRLRQQKYFQQGWVMEEK